MKSEQWKERCALQKRLDGVADLLAAPIQADEDETIMTDEVKIPNKARRRNVHGVFRKKWLYSP
jgi:hypothetical protein